MASLYKQDALTQIGLEPTEPAWFQSHTKKVISNHFSQKKHLGFQLSPVSGKKDSKTNGKDSSKGVSSSDFNIVSFGTTHHNNSITGADSLMLVLTDHTDSILENDDLPLYSNSDDLPPTRSLHDLNDEIMISLNKPTQHTESFINKDPRLYVNVFSKDETLTIKDSDKKATKNTALNSEAAILVFGYPESMATQVIAHFLELGTILEEFEAAKETTSLAKNTLTTFAGALPLPVETPKRDSRVVPIFSGQSWVKITYGNPASAIDALQESGTVFNGVLIGVVPYTKDAVEKLKKRKITLLEDIGGGVSANSNAANSKGDQVLIGENDIQSAYSKRIEVKDGSGLFLTSQNNTTSPAKGDAKCNQKLGLLSSIANYIFGFYEL
ncbi:MPPN-domain-containing protein [Metschnikowia bicuspidata]|uniref:MPPN-domain-containing protein n=1 Tax=Metschnikowia bicuspidata TaxID=27322 RepID=A0A4P9ZI36_9ASCO|nr:MPPN-domain-containing protein [Metschnikowia bicuspidata]